MRVCFLGSPRPAVPALRALLAAPDVDVAAVVTNPDRPSGRGHERTPTPVKVAAEQAGVPVWQPQRATEITADLRQLSVDACAVVAYGALLPAAVLAAGGAGFVNLHFSVLPRWRGAAPVPHAILAGDDVTGVTCFVLDEGMDTGPVITSAETPIGPSETAGQLTARLAELGAPLLVDAVRALVDGSADLRPQDHDAATHAPKLGPDDARLDWRGDAAALARAVRAFNPVPGAHTTFAGRRLKVHTARAVAADAAGAGVGGGGGASPGQVLRADEDGPVVACGAGALLLAEVQPAGKARMGGADFVNGYRPVGQRLGP